MLGDDVWKTAVNNSAERGSGRAEGVIGERREGGGDERQRRLVIR